MKVVTLGIRKIKVFLCDMDDWGGGFRKEWGSQHFAEPRDISRCGECNNEGHNNRGCSSRGKRKRSNEMVMVVSAMVMVELKDVAVEGVQD